MPRPVRERPPRTAPRAPRQPDPRPARSLQRLQDAAIELAAEHGIDGTTVDDIAERAHVAKGTVYYNVASKDDLFTGALVAGVDRLAMALAEAAEGLAGTAALRAVVSTMLTRVTSAADFARLILAEAWRPGRPWHSELRAARERAVGVVEEVLRENTTPGVDTGLAATVVFSATLVTGLDLAADGSAEDTAVQAAADQLMTLFTRAGAG
ncbi:MAG TPA: TetR/AcrR family transcriptional regulator [Streptosporangiaceae bacterium]|nr:TetR/AcrR family transcriptional regulator [Streptosporangiaceae bacterium]